MSEAPGFQPNEKIYVGVEAGHLYSPHHFGEKDAKAVEALHGLALAVRVRDRLEQADYDTHQIFFVDDVYPREEQPKSEDAWRWQAFMNRPLQQASQMIEVPLRVVSEHDAIAPGLAIVDQIKAKAEGSNSYRISRDGRHIIYGQGQESKTIPLMGYQIAGTDHPDLPSCEVMDLATYKQRIKADGQTVTLLPEWYGPEQARVQKLFEVLGERPPIVTGFYDKSGQVTSVADWSGGHFDELADLIRQVDVQ